LNLTALNRTRDSSSDQLSQVGWVPKGHLDKRQWLEFGRALGRLGRNNKWWLGDWLLYADREWGEMYTDAVRATGFENGSLRNMAYIAQRFELSRRRDNLSWGHHANVASLDVAEQEVWLDRASDLGWGVHDLRTELRSTRRLKSTGSDRDESTRRELRRLATIVCPNCNHEVPIPRRVGTGLLAREAGL
jgi:hypothetical protein